MDDPIENIETYNIRGWVIKAVLFAIVGGVSILLFQAVRDLARIGRPIGAPYASDSLYLYRRNPKDEEACKYTAEKAVNAL